MDGLLTRSEFRFADATRQPMRYATLLPVLFVLMSVLHPTEVAQPIFEQTHMMQLQGSTSHLPITTVGLPSAVTHWLRLAAVPTVPLEISCLVPGHADDAAGKILVYDSRNASSRAHALAAGALAGLQTIDIATIHSREFRSAETPSSNRRARERFLMQLKREIEGSG
jgi:hypothetical protein